MNLWKFIMIGFLVSCSHTKTHQPGTFSKEKKTDGNLHSRQGDSNKSKETYETTGEKTMQAVSRRLEELTASAQAVGKHAVEYLASDIFLKANAASMHGDWNTAKVLYKHLMNLVPEDDYARRKFAESLIRVGQLNEAQVQLEGLYKKSKEKNEKVGLVLGGVYTALLEKEQARKIYVHLMKINPKNHDACIFLGKSYAQEGDPKQGLQILEKCERRNPQVGIYSFYMGKIALEQEKNDEALKYFKKSLKLDSKNSTAALAVGVLYEEKGKAEEALKVYRAFLDENPSDTTVLNKIVEILFSLSRNQEVIPYISTLTQLDPENLNLKVKLGILYTDSGNYEKAKDIFNELLERVPNSDKILYYLGAIYQETNEFEKAIELFSKIPPESSLFHGSSLQIAHILMTTASNDEDLVKSLHVKAFLDFTQEKGLAYPDIKVQMFVLRASFYENKMDVAKAIETLELVKNEKDFDKTHSYYLATLYEKANRFDEAFSIGMKILKEDPQNAHAWNFLGYSLLERGKDLNKAYEYIQKALALKPEDGFIRDSLGWYYYKIGKLDLALKEMQNARKIVTDDVVISKHLAIVYQSLKQFNLAKKYYAEALKNTKIESERLGVVKAMEEMALERVPASVPNQ